MKLKLDENLGPAIAGRARAAGHDVALTREEGLNGKSDDVVIEVCRAEGPRAR